MICEDLASWRYEKIIHGTGTCANGLGSLIGRMGGIIDGRMVGWTAGIGTIAGGIGGTLSSCTMGGLEMGQVEATFWRRWSRWPWIIARDAGGYFRMILEVISSHDVKNQHPARRRLLKGLGAPLLCVKRQCVVGEWQVVEHMLLLHWLCAIEG